MHLKLTLSSETYTNENIVIVIDTWYWVKVTNPSSN